MTIALKTKLSEIKDGNSVVESNAASNLLSLVEKFESNTISKMQFLTSVKTCKQNHKRRKGLEYQTVINLCEEICSLY